MSKNSHNKLSRRVAVLREELGRIPDPAREAEKKLKWQAAIAAFAKGDPNRLTIMPKRRLCGRRLCATTTFSWRRNRRA